MNELKGLEKAYKEAADLLVKSEKALYVAEAKSNVAKDELSKLQELGYGVQQVDSFIKVPVLGHIAAGQPLFAYEHILDWEYIPSPGKYEEGEIFALIVKGDSMTGARIYEGDKVILRVQQEVEDGEIAVINVMERMPL